VLAVHDRVTALGVPVPDSDSVALFDALLVRDSVLVAVPLLVGEKTTLNDALCPAGIVTGKVTPLKLNSEFVLEAEEIVTLAPDAVTVIGSVAELPTFTLPKFNGVGEMVREPAVLAAPVPDIDSVVVLFEALLANDKVPDALPLLVGEKTTLNDAL
jgi:hypothetical protein